MPKNALAPTPANAFNMAPYEAQYQLRPFGDGRDGRVKAANVNAALLPALMRAHFGEYLAFSPATVTTKPTSGTRTGEFEPRTKEIRLSPEGINSLIMRPVAGGGYVGTGEFDSATTEETLNALRTMLHEATHARMLPTETKRSIRPHPSEQLYRQMPADRFDEMIRDIRISGLPSVEETTLPGDIINEYFATAIPARMMEKKNMVTRQNRRMLKEIDYLSKKYPELNKMMADYERPELFVKD